MGSNDRIVFDTIFNESKKLVADETTPDKYFEFFTSEQILKDYDLNDEEVESGIIGNGGDGGFDSFYVFINDDLLREDTDISIFPGNVKFDIYIVQSKRNEKFSESVIDKFILTSEELFDLEKDLNILALRYNSSLIDKITKFKQSFLKLSKKIKSINFHFHYATVGNTDSIHHNVHDKQERLKATMQKLFSSATFNFTFVGARELIKLSRSEPSQAFEIKLSENAISTGSENDGYIGLVKLEDYFDFITDEHGRIRKNIFEANVRDYQGDVKVNQGILKTLESDTEVDFWWLNNGITIVCTEASVRGGKRMVVENAQIVNGLQTSNVIYNYFSHNDSANLQRNILARILVTKDEETRDRITKATNSQTRIPDASLRATDPIHRDIETYLLSKDFYYERRKNYYKNIGKQKNKIVSISYIAQAVMSILLRKPDYARARPSTLLNNDDEYSKVFSTSYPVAVYYSCIILLKGSEQFLRNEKLSLNSKQINNYKFYLAMLVAINTLQKKDYSAEDICAITIPNPTEEIFSHSFKKLITLFDTLGDTDATAKGPTLIAKLLS